MTLTFPTWASFCIWLPGYSRASESKSEFCPTFFISPSESELNSMRCGTGVHTHHESLSPAPPDQFPACRSGHPRYASDVAHTPAPQRSDTGQLPALRPPQPVAHVAVFFGRSLTISRKAVWHLLHPARRTCVWGGYTPERECPATPRSRVLECDAPRPGKSWP